MDPTTVEWLLNFGALGVVVVLLALGILVPGWVYKKLERENEALRDNLAVERTRNADLQQFAAMGQRALTALAEVAQEHRSQDAAGASREPVVIPSPAPVEYKG